MIQDDSEVERLERKVEQMRHVLDGLHEEIQSLRWVRGPKTGAEVRGKG